MAGGDHGHAWRVEIELGEIGGRREAETDIQNLAAGADEAKRQGLLHRQGIGAKVVSDHDPALAHLLDQGSQTQAKSLDAHEIELGAELPTCVVFAKAGGFHQRRGLISQGVGRKVGTRKGEHETCFLWRASGRWRLAYGMAERRR
jgi:hypothetical protein